MKKLTVFGYSNPKLFKILIIMKTIILLMILGMGNVFAINSYSQTGKVTLNMKNTRIEAVLAAIEKNSDYYFAYNQKLIDVNRKIDIDMENKEIRKVLSFMFKDQGVNYVVINHQIVLSPGSMPEIITENAPAVSKLTGTVKSASDNQPIPGVSVYEKGTQNGTITDINGKYSIQVENPQATLVFSYIGFVTMEIPVQGKTVIDVTMNVQAMELEQVVVTALGVTRQEKALGYATQKVMGNTLISVKSIDVSAALTGKVAGLLVKNTTEFAAESDVLLRGEKALLVIDGVPYGNMTLRDVPSDDIDNISVLKGATAAALYGDRGRYGAIMITTKKGSAKKGLSISINTGTMFTAGYLAIPEMQSRFGRAVNTNKATGVVTATSSGDGSWGPQLDGRMVTQWDPVSKSVQSMPFLPSGKDNFSNFVEQGYVLNNNINLVQQGENGSFRSSVTWVKNKGQYPNSMFDKLTYTIGGDMNVNKFKFSSSLTYNKQNSPQIGFNGYTAYDPMYNLLVWSAPDYDVRDMKDYWIVKNETQNTSYSNTNNNPYFDRYERLHSLNRDVFNGTFATDYDISSWLKATFRTGYDMYSDRQTIRISKGSLQGAGAATVTSFGDQVWGESQLGSYNEGFSRGFSTSNDLLLTGNKTFKDFSVGYLAGGSVFYRKDEGIEAFTQGGLLLPGYYSLKASTTPAITHSSTTAQQLNSLYGSLSLSWKKLLYLDATYRNDWSSTLRKSNQSYSYPSLSGSFIVSEILPKMEWLSLWKIRSSWSTARNIPDPYEVNAVYNVYNNTWGTLSSAALSTAIRSSDVKSEGATNYEIGTAVNVLKNRASLDVTLYKRREYDGLVYAGSSPASGYSNSYINWGQETARKGIEISANGTLIKNKDWQWDIAINLSSSADYYTKIDTTYSLKKPWVAVGERADAYILSDFLKDPDGNLILNNGLPQYSNYASRFGYSDPKFIWGANTTVKYKNWQLFVSVDGRVGGLTQTTTEMYMWRAGSHPGSVTDAREKDETAATIAALAGGGAAGEAAVTAAGLLSKNYTGQGVKVVSGTVAYDVMGNITSDTRVFAPNDIAVTYENYTTNLHKGTAWGGAASPVDVYSTTFFKIRELSVTYSLPQSILTKIHSNGLSISAVGQNLYLRAKQFKYSDPDGGYENFSDPSQRYIGFNIKATF